MYSGRFFGTDSEYLNHKIVNIISIDDEEKVAHVVLQRYIIDGLANVYTDGKQLSNVKIPYAEFANLNL
jgi:hypothetical protein